MIRWLIILVLLSRGCYGEPAFAARVYHHSPRIHTISRAIPWTAYTYHPIQLVGTEPTGETYIIKK